MWTFWPIIRLLLGCLNIGCFLNEYWTVTCTKTESYTQWRKKNAFFFQIIVTFFIFNIKNYVNTKTTCNKCSFDYLTLITQLQKIISERWRPSCRTHVQSLSSKFCITFTNISCGTVAISSRMETFRSSLYEVFERRLLLWGNPKERNRRQIQKHVLFAPPCVC